MLALGEDSTAGCPYLICSSVGENLGEGQVWGMGQGPVIRLLSACKRVFTSCLTPCISAVLEERGCDTDLPVTREGRRIFTHF